MTVTDLTSNLSKVISHFSLQFNFFKMFAIKNPKRHIALLEDEPPEKKLVSDGDLLIKELYKKQTNTKVDLKE